MWSGHVTQRLDIVMSPSENYFNLFRKLYLLFESLSAHLAVRQEITSQWDSRQRRTDDRREGRRSLRCCGQEQLRRTNQEEGELVPEYTSWHTSSFQSRKRSRCQSLQGLRPWTLIGTSRNRLAARCSVMETGLHGFLSQSLQEDPSGPHRGHDDRGRLISGSCWHYARSLHSRE